MVVLGLCLIKLNVEFSLPQSPYRTVLRDTAIPTIFDLTSHLSNPHSRHRKRIKILVHCSFQLLTKVLMKYISLIKHMLLYSLSSVITYIQTRSRLITLFHNSIFMFLIICLEKVSLHTAPNISIHGGN